MKDAAYHDKPLIFIGATSHFGSLAEQYQKRCPISADREPALLLLTTNEQRSLEVSHLLSAYVQ